jgi:DNA polymerase-3 subunit gamma/tau
MSKEPYVVLARKYRPGAFDDVLGQPAISVTLKNALASKRIAHAYLFTGPRGVGKTTMARILAKALNCKNGPTPEPCGKCPACTEIASSSSIDVLEMDAASHTGVDNVREVIIETVALAPSRDRYKVFIIDEAHMLSTGAFNALLKTLEEPPSHVVFILATTELAKVPATIASRCQRFKFRPISVEDLTSHLGSLAKKEKIDISAEALELLARGAEGALRDAVSLLDQCRSFSEGAVTPELICEMFGLVPREMLQGLAQALVARDAAGLGGQLRKIYEEGVDPAQLLRDLRTALEGAYLERLGAGLGAQEAPFKALEGASSQQLSFLLRRVNETLADLRSSDSPRLVLELGLFGCLEAAGDLKDWVERLEALERRLLGGGVLPPPRPLPQAPGVAKKTTSHFSSVEAWGRVVESVRQEKPLLSTALETGRLVPAENGPWKLLFRRPFDVEQAKRGQALIEAKLSTEAGLTVRLLIELGESPPAAAVPQAGDSGPEVPPGLEDAPPPEPSEPAKPVAAASGGLKRAAKILGGTPRFIKKKDA